MANKGKGPRSRRGRRGKRTKEMVRIARERIDNLMDLSVRMALGGDLQKADRYSGLARRIGMRYNVRMRPDHRLLFCRKCNSFMLPSRTQSIRLRRGRRVARCLKCGDIRRTPIDKARTATTDRSARGRRGE